MVRHRVFPRLAPLALALLLGACTLSGFPPPAGPGDPDLEVLLALVNEARAEGAVCGSEAHAPVLDLRWNGVLGRTAQLHSEDMEAAGTMSHITPLGAVHFEPGTTFDSRIAQQGYRYRSAGENIAYGFSSPESVVSAWLASPGHCRNIMGSSYLEIGLGREGSFWTQVFASPAN